MLQNVSQQQAAGTVVMVCSYISNHQLASVLHDNQNYEEELRLLKISQSISTNTKQVKKN